MNAVYDARMHTLRIPLLASALLMALVSCSPGTETAATGASPVGVPVAAEQAEAMPALERTAWEAWHLMQIGFLRTGVYSTNVLVDLPLPQGVRWSVVGFEEQGYAIDVTSDDAEGGYRVDPSGVRPTG